MLVPHAFPSCCPTLALYAFWRSAGAAIAIDAADVALFTNDLKCLAPVIKLGRNAKRKILLNISLSVVTKVRLAYLVRIHRPSCLACDVTVSLATVVPDPTASDFGLFECNYLGKPSYII